MLGILVEGAWAIEDLLVLLIIVALDARFVNSDDNVVWSTAAILTRFGPFWPITTTIPMVTAAVAMALVVGSVVAAASWAMSARIHVEVYFGLFSVDILIGGHNHLANPCWRLAIELRAEVVVMESSDEGGDDLSFHDVRNIIPHLRKASDVARRSSDGFW